MPAQVHRYLVREYVEGANNARGNHDVGTVVTNYCLKRGLLHKDELEAFPAALRKKMKLGSALVLLGCIGMLLESLGIFPYGLGRQDALVAVFDCPVQYRPVPHQDSF